MKVIEEYEESVLKQYLPVIVIFVALLFFFVFHVVGTWNSTGYKIKNSFHGIVTSKYMSRSWVYVGFKDKTFKQEIKDAYNYDYNTPSLIDFVQTGDLLWKNKCSDTIFVERGGVEYHFIELAFWYNNDSKTDEYKLEYMTKRLNRLSEAGCEVDYIAKELLLELIKRK